MALSLFFGIGLCLFFYWFSSSGYLAVFLEWVKDLGYWGNLFFVIAFTITGLPFMLIGYTPLGLAAGYIYGRDGPILGIIEASVTVLIGTITGSVLGFVLCRMLLKNWFQRKIDASPVLQAFMQTMESKGFFLVLVMRMAPIPFGVQNGLFSVSNVSILSFAVATVVGLVPEIVMLVYMGTTMADLTSIVTGKFEFGFWQQLTLGLEIGVSLILCILLFFFSREAMRKVKERQKQMELDDLELELEHADDAADLFECGSVPPINESDRSRILDAIDGKNSADDSGEESASEGVFLISNFADSPVNSLSRGLEEGIIATQQPQGYT
jgi:uncharacterized membrane protein YdjX (TVP38/TMEM64 family)